MTVVEQVLQDALALPPADRAFVVDQLELSLEKGSESGGFASPDIAAAWSDEIGRRVSSYDRGDIQAEDADVVIRRMRGFLSEHINRKVES